MADGSMAGLLQTAMEKEAESLAEAGAAAGNGGNFNQ
jgi:hypothetical protein